MHEKKRTMCLRLRENCMVDRIDLLSAGILAIILQFDLAENSNSLFLHFSTELGQITIYHRK